MDSDDDSYACSESEDEVGDEDESDDSTCDYQCLTSEQLHQLMKNTISEIQVVIPDMKATPLRILLSKFRWDKELLLEKIYMGEEEREQLFKDAHIVNPEGHRNPVGEFMDCQICFCSFQSKLMVGLDCGHLYCKDCWDDYLTTRIVDEGQSQMISCPTFNCELLVDDELVMNLIKKKSVKAKYQHFITDCFVKCNRSLRWCPKPDCLHSIRCRSTPDVPVECVCGHRFCFKCGEDWHAPITCVCLRKWKQKCADDSETSHWINAHTKECPKCKAIIEKNGGCNHMVCRSQTCKYEFCWACLGPWDPHGPSWYNCNRYTASESKNARQAQELEQQKSREMLQRYLFYFDRYTNHHQSFKFENKLHVRIQHKMEDLQKNKQLTWNEVQFLKMAVEILCDCRKTLMYTYVFAFYLKSNNQSRIFEDNQADLERATEQLSEFLERDIFDENSHSTVKFNVQNKSSYCKSRRKVLLDHVYEGYEKDWWQYNE